MTLGGVKRKKILVCWLLGGLLSLFVCVWVVFLFFFFSLFWWGVSLVGHQ